jgi:SAM-dependent methyltransferase
MSTNWWENFFHGIALDFWRAVVSPQQTSAEADFIQKQLQLEAGAKILDVPCGNGRLAIELTARGFNLTGVDLAAEFIAEAMSASVERKLEIEWHNREMRDLPWTAEFDGAFCFGNSFGYLDDEANVAFLQTLTGTLKPGARFVLDAPAIAECLLPAFQERKWIEVAGITFLSSARYDYEQGRLFTEYSFIRDGKTEKRPASQRIYTYHELSGLLTNAGFEIVASFSSLNDEPFRLGARRLLLVVSKI